MMGVARRRLTRGVSKRVSHRVKPSKNGRKRRIETGPQIERWPCTFRDIASAFSCASVSPSPCTRLYILCAGPMRENARSVCRGCVAKCAVRVRRPCRPVYLLCASAVRARVPPVYRTDALFVHNFRPFSRTFHERSLCRDRHGRCTFRVGFLCVPHAPPNAGPCIARMRFRAPLFAPPSAHFMRHLDAVGCTFGVSPPCGNPRPPFAAAMRVHVH